MTQPSTPHAYEAQATAQRNALAEQLRATENDLADTRAREAAVRQQLTRTEQVLAAEEQNSIRELAAAVEAEQQAARLRAAWQSACRRSTHHLHGKWAAQTTAQTFEAHARTAEAKLAALHEGEEAYEDERVIPTPGQWIWLWNRATPGRRREAAERALANADLRFNHAMNHWPERAQEAEAQVAAAHREIEQILRETSGFGLDGVTLPQLVHRIRTAINSAQPTVERPGHAGQSARSMLLNLLAGWGMDSSHGSRAIVDEALRRHALELAAELPTRGTLGAALNDAQEPTHESRVWETDGEWNVSCTAFGCPAYCDNIGGEDDAEQWAADHLAQESTPAGGCTCEPFTECTCSAILATEPGNIAAASPEAARALKRIYDVILSGSGIDEGTAPPVQGPAITFEGLRDVITEYRPAPVPSANALAELIARARSLDPDGCDLYLRSSGPGPIGTVAAHPRTLSILRTAEVIDPNSPLYGSILHLVGAELYCSDPTIPLGEIQLRTANQPEPPSPADRPAWQSPYGPPQPRR